MNIILFFYIVFARIYSGCDMEKYDGAFYSGSNAHLCTDPAPSGWIGTIEYLFLVSL